VIGGVSVAFYLNKRLGIKVPVEFNPRATRFIFGAKRRTHGAMRFVVGAVRRPFGAMRLNLDATHSNSNPTCHNSIA